MRIIDIQDELRDIVASVNELKANNQPVPESVCLRVQELTDLYNKIKNTKKSKGETTMSNRNIDKKIVNKALRSYIMNDVESYKEIMNTATGTAGALTDNGAALVPSELLAPAEFGKTRVDLKQFVNVVNVGTRTGSIPVVDYSSQSGMSLVAFDENTEITKGQATFPTIPFSLTSRGRVAPVSRELITDADSDVLSIVGNIFAQVSLADDNKGIADAAYAAGVAAEQAEEANTIASAIDQIKVYAITLPGALGDCKVLTTKAIWAKLALAKNADGEYLLARDANGNTVKEIEGCEVIVLENTQATNAAVVVGDLTAIYHICNPDVEIASSTESGFTRNSVDVRCIKRAQAKSACNTCFGVVTLASGL